MFASLTAYNICQEIKSLKTLISNLIILFEILLRHHQHDILALQTLKIGKHNDYSLEQVIINIQTTRFHRPWLITTLQSFLSLQSTVDESFSSRLMNDTSKRSRDCHDLLRLTPSKPVVVQRQ